MGKDPKKTTSKTQLDLEDWNLRFIQQASWTKSIRATLLSNSALAGEKVLEVGCGTGAILNDLPLCKLLVGLDIQYRSLQFAKKLLTHHAFVGADGVELPFNNAAFDITFCHFLLLWVRSPLKILAEMKRVTKSGGIVAALAEPDHAARIDHPQQLEQLGKLQTDALIDQGADVACGRKLSGWFEAIRLKDITAGSLGWKKPDRFNTSDWELEWKVLAADLDNSKGSKKQLDALKKVDLAAWHHGDRILFVPTFYAFGYVP